MKSAVVRLLWREDIIAIGTALPKLDWVVQGFIDWVVQGFIDWVVQGFIDWVVQGFISSCLFSHATLGNWASVQIKVTFLYSIVSTPWDR